VGLRPLFEFEISRDFDVFRLRKLLGAPFAPGVRITPWLFAVTHDAKLVLSGGHWDNSLCVYSSSRGKTIASIVRHNGLIFCDASVPSSCVVCAQM
jgi:hypothetical protein